MEEHEQNGITSTTSFIDEEEQEEALIALVNHRCRQVKNLHDQVPPFSLCHMLPFLFTHMVWLIMPNCYITILGLNINNHHHA